MPSFVVAVSAPDVSADDLARRLRLAPVPVVPRIHEDRVLLDMRTVRPDEIPDVLDAVAVAQQPADGAPPCPRA
jgi:L-seryl-tRNA(Ser) seleniumtransferase